MAGKEPRHRVPDSNISSVLALPLVVRIMLKQAVVVGGVPLITLHAILNRDRLATGYAKG